MHKELPSESPFSRCNWHGKIWSLDKSVSLADFTIDDLDEVLYEYEEPQGGGWDGDCAGVCRLKDGRFVAWESWWGPTGSGFCCDAYGGTADIYIAATLEDALTFGISKENRERFLGKPDETN